MSPGRDREPPHRLSDPLTRTLLALTFVTGIVDAVSFLGLAQVFSAMQTGNVIFLGFGIAGEGGTSVGAPLVALGAFVVGGVATVAIGSSRGGLGLGATLAAEAALLAGAALLAAVADPSAREAAAYVLIGALSFAMGLRNATARRLGGQNLATTVLNLTPVLLAPGAAAGVASRGDLAERGAALVAILAGAAVGALLLDAALWLPIAVAAGVVALVGIAAARARRPAAA
jgi:uncharacterized membrane protein YoaK (UPF0700 family)